MRPLRRSHRVHASRGRRRLVVTTALAVVAAAAHTLGCAGSNAIIVQQATPNPFPGKTHFVFEQVGDARVFVGDGHVAEAAWIEAQDAPVREGHPRARAALTRCFNDELRGQLPDLTFVFAPDTDPGALVVKTNLEWVAASWENGRAQAKTRLGIVVVTPEGQLLDDVAFERNAVESATSRWEATEVAYCRCGTELARGVRTYLRERVGAK